MKGIEFHLASGCVMSMSYKAQVLPPCMPPLPLLTSYLLPAFVLDPVLLLGLQTEDHVYIYICMCMYVYVYDVYVYMICI